MATNPPYGLYNTVHNLLGRLLVLEVRVEELENKLKEQKSSELTEQEERDLEEYDVTC